MRALQYTQFGTPQEVLGLSEVETATPAAGQVLVETILSPIHNHDLWTITGNYGFKPALPAIGGSEAVGTVAAVGPDVDSGWIGKRVVASGNGTWADAYLTRAAGLMEVPDAIADEAAAQLVAMPFSSIALLEWLKLERGDWIIQNAANGAVGKLVAKLAQPRGIKVLSLVRRAEAVAELEALGMAPVISTNAEDWIDRAREIVGEDGARAAIDSVGGKLVDGMAELLGYKGTLVAFGSVTGSPLVLQTGPIIFKQLSIKGFWGAKAIGEFPDADRARMMGELMALAAKGELPLDVDGVYALADHKEAIAAAQEAGRKGKVLLRP